jgi:NAD(P)-dependent dehydrogenase (short-subunit alcohol dehydrogenase family)
MAQRRSYPLKVSIFMISDFKNKTAVLTGSGSGFGLECARIGAKLAMNLVLADVQQDALDKTVAEMRALGAPVLAMRVDVSKADQMQALADAAFARFGAPHFVFNNAGVGAGGLIWENTVQDWDWVLGVNVMGVVHGVRLFTPMMLAAAKADPTYQGHIVNTASMAGLLNAPNMGIYNVSKHAVVSLSETLYQDLALVTDQISASVLCPFFVPTGISQSHRNRPDELKVQGKPTQSQLIGQAMSDKAVGSGKVTAAQVAQMVFDAIAANQFYIYSHPKSIASVQVRMEDVLMSRNPTDPFAHKPELGVELKKALRA